MNKPFSEKYHLIITKDGSPTLEFQQNGIKENMHNFHGAFSETNYIYGEALSECHRNGWPLNILSIGLGLGYNEILSAAFAVQNKIEIEIESYEQDPELKHLFLQWLNGQECELYEAYDQILNLYAQKMDVSKVEILEELTRLLSIERLVIKDKFSASKEKPQKFSVMFYDPFSSKTNPEFWSQEAIETVLERWAGPQCVISTYAATGALRRALKNQQFQLQTLPGFGGKRQSFLGVRDCTIG